MFQLQAKGQPTTSDHGSNYAHGMAFDYDNNHLYVAYARDSNSDIDFKRYMLKADGSFANDSVSIPTIDGDNNPISRGPSLAVFKGNLYVAYRDGGESGGGDNSIYMAYLDISALGTNNPPSWSSLNSSNAIVTNPSFIENWPSHTSPLYDSHHTDRYPEYFKPTTDQSPVLVITTDARGNQQYLHLAAKNNKHAISYGWFAGVGSDHKWHWNPTAITDWKDDPSRTDYQDYSCSVNIPHSPNEGNKKDFLKSERNPTMVFFNQTIYMAWKYNYSTKMYSYPILLAMGSEDEWVAEYEAFGVHHSNTSSDFSTYDLYSDSDEAYPGTLFTFGSQHTPAAAQDLSVTPRTQFAPALGSMQYFNDGVYKHTLVMVYIDPDSKTTKDYQNGTVRCAFSTDLGATWSDSGAVLDVNGQAITVDSHCKGSPILCEVGTGNTNSLCLSISSNGNALIYPLRIQNAK